jgi:hypothetical protein
MDCPESPHAADEEIGLEPPFDQAKLDTILSSLVRKSETDICKFLDDNSAHIHNKASDTGMYKLDSR